MASYSVSDLCEIQGPPILMGMLLNAVRRRTTLTYKDVADYIGSELKATIGWFHIGGVAGTLMGMIWEIDANAPPLNVLVVNGRTGLPGDGADWFVEKYLPKVNYEELNDERKREVIAALRDEIFSYDSWASIAAKLFGRKFAAKGGRQPPGEHDGKARRSGFGGPAESPEHKRLKEHVAQKGSYFGAPSGAGQGHVEKRLESGDETDVWFMVPGHQLAVEVKSVRSTDADMLRGIYQCVKYRAVLMAQMKANRTESNVRVLLVTERALSESSSTIARRLEVEVKTIRPLA